MTGSPATTGKYAILMKGIDKTFGPVRANRGASLEVREGEDLGNALDRPGEEAPQEGFSRQNPRAESRVHHGL